MKHFLYVKWVVVVIYTLMMGKPNLICICLQDIKSNSYSLSNPVGEDIFQYRNPIYILIKLLHFSVDDVMSNYSEVLKKYESYDLVLDEKGCLKAAIEAYPPYTTYDGKNFGGSCFYIFDMIMNKLGLCYHLIKSPEGIWGNEFPNGSWNGLVGLGQRKDVEAIVCPVATLYRRYLAIDYSETVISTDYSIVYPRPVVKPNLLGFVLPFSLQTWILLFVSLVFVTVMSFVANKTLFPHLNKLIERNDSTAGVAYIPNGYWFKSVLAQPSEKFPREIGSRIIIGIWMLMVMVLGVVFRCNLKALLIIQKVEIPFNTLEGLVNQDEIQWSFLTGSIIPQYFKPAYDEDPNSIMGKGWKDRGELYKSALQIRDFVVNRHMACIAITSKILEVYSEDFSLTGKCRLATARESLIKVELAFGLKKKSKFADLLNPYIRNLREFGLLDKIFGEDTANATYCNVPPGSELRFKERSLSVVDFLGIFSILGAGYVLAIVAFLIELTVKKIELQK